MPEFLTQGSLFIVFAALLGAGVGLPISEDVVLLATGALAEQGVFDVIPALLTCAAGVLAGDFAIYTIARALGPRLFETRVGRRLVSTERRERAEAMFRRRGRLTVFFARFLIGLRLPLFATAGALEMRRRDFLLFDALGLTLSAPLVFFVGYTSASHLPAILDALGQAGLVVPLLAVAALGLYIFVARRRRLAPAIVTDAQVADRHDD